MANKRLILGRLFDARARSLTHLIELIDHVIIIRLQGRVDGIRCVKDFTVGYIFEHFIDSGDVGRGGGGGVRGGVRRHRGLERRGGHAIAGGGRRRRGLRRGVLLFVRRLRRQFSHRPRRGGGGGRRHRPRDDHVIGGGRGLRRLFGGGLRGGVRRDGHVIGGGVRGGGGLRRRLLRGGQ